MPTTIGTTPIHAHAPSSGGESTTQRKIPMVSSANTKYCGGWILRGVAALGEPSWPSVDTGLSFCRRARGARGGRRTRSGGSVVRYVMEFLIPAMVVIVAALVLFRNRPDQAARASANRTND